MRTLNQEATISLGLYQGWTEAFLAIFKITFQSSQLHMLQKAYIQSSVAFSQRFD